MEVIEMQKIFLSKKVIVSLVGLIVSVIIAAGINLPDDTQKLLIEVILGIISSFNIGQGIADGLSKGRTSAGRDIYD